jgi:hypothetical protein
VAYFRGLDEHLPGGLGTIDFRAKNRKLSNMKQEYHPHSCKDQ